MSEAALCRVARAGDGWHPTGLTPDELRGQLAQLRLATQALGRDTETLDICMRFNLALDDVEVTEVELRSTIDGYDAERIVEVASAYAAAGVTHFIYALNSHEPDVLDSTVDALARDLLPHFNNA
jgi:alkanesulfonate monooxygenase SsuD/methylene tetrahydromethanopterin reductase-like flavin-dependent oxidoreductase (luciferase family)